MVFTLTPSLLRLCIQPSTSASSVASHAHAHILVGFPLHSLAVLRLAKAFRVRSAARGERCRQTDKGKMVDVLCCGGRGEGTQSRKRDRQTLTKKLFNCKLNLFLKPFFFFPSLFSLSLLSLSHTHTHSFYSLTALLFSSLS